MKTSVVASRSHDEGDGLKDMIISKKRLSDEKKIHPEGYILTALQVTLHFYSLFKKLI